MNPIKLFLTISLLVWCTNATAQTNTIHGSIHTDLETVGFGVGGTYAPDNFGFYGLLTADLSHKATHPNLETGISADVARSFRVTQQSENWAHVNMGGMYKANDNMFLVAAPGITVYRNFTEHAERYWVENDYFTRFNMGFGAIFTHEKAVTINIIAFTNPGSLSIGVGYKLRETNEPD